MLKKSEEEGTLLAGGYSLLLLLQFRSTELGTIIDISRIPDLNGVRVGDD